MCSIKCVEYWLNAEEGTVQSHPMKGVLVGSDRAHHHIMQLGTLNIDRVPLQSSIKPCDGLPHGITQETLRDIVFKTDGRPNVWNDTRVVSKDGSGKGQWSGSGLGPVQLQVQAALLADLRRVFDASLPRRLGPRNFGNMTLWFKVSDYLAARGTIPKPEALLADIIHLIPSSLTLDVITAGFLQPASATLIDFRTAKKGPPLLPPLLQNHSLATAAAAMPQQNQQQDLLAGSSHGTVVVVAAKDLPCEPVQVVRTSHNIQPGDCAMPLVQPALPYHSGQWTPTMYWQHMQQPAVQVLPGCQRLVATAVTGCQAAMPSDSGGFAYVAAEPLLGTAQAFTGTAVAQQQTSLAAAQPSTGTAPAQPSTGTAAAQAVTGTAAAQQQISLAAAQPSTGTAPAQPSTGTAAAQAVTGTAAAQQHTSLAAAQPFTGTAAAQAFTGTAAAQQHTSLAAAQPSTGTAAGAEVMHRTSIGSKALDGLLAAEPVVQPTAAIVNISDEKAQTLIRSHISPGDGVYATFTDKEGRQLGWVLLQVVRVLGIGGNGAVYSASVQRLAGSCLQPSVTVNSLLVFKVSAQLLLLHAQQQSPPEAVRAMTAAAQASLLEEYASMQDCSRCANTVQAYGFGMLHFCNKVSSELPVLLMEYCNLGSWGDLLFPNSQANISCIKTDAASVHYIMQQLVKALTYIGDNDILHRDIKPDNILFQGSSLGCCAAGAPPAESFVSKEAAYPFQVKLGDFGCARYKRACIGRTKCVGTPNYQSPEIGCREEINHNALADVWSVVMCFLVARLGVRSPFLSMGMPFTNMSYLQAQEVAKQQLERLSSVYGGGLTQREIEFVVGGLQGDPAYRWTPYQLWRSAYISKGPGDQDVVQP